MIPDLQQTHWRGERGFNNGGHTFANGLCIAWQRGPVAVVNDNLKPDNTFVDNTPKPNGCTIETVILAATGRLEFFLRDRCDFERDEYTEALSHLNKALESLGRLQDKINTWKLRDKKIFGTV